MAREPGLHALAQYGFVNLSEARETLDTRGWSGDWFRSAASPDKALAWLSRLVVADDGGLLHALSDPGLQLREGLVRVLGASDGLAEFLLRSPASAVRALAPENLPTADEYRSDMLGRPGLTSDSLRHAYREHLVTVAAWDLMQPSATRAVQGVGEALADLADATVNAAVELARSTLAVDPTTLSSVRLAVIAMGKTGARELNYLSDIDVIFVCESDTVEEHVGIEVATKLARSVIAILNEPGVEPPLWEIDANLRPEGAKGALVRSLESHVAYYERWAENWEFQALLKSRPMAGDMTLGMRYREAIEPFVWSSSSRPGFVESAQRMRERVAENVPDAERDSQIKLGPGGLRDVEFTVQLLQLVHGKDDDTVRTRDTLTSLERLADGGYVGRADGQRFSDAYRSLRVLEHRVQLLNLRRTHLMPVDDEVRRVLARGSGLADTSSSLMDWWVATKLSVRSLHEAVFYRPLLDAVASLPDGAGSLTSEQAQARLAATGFTDPAGALRHIASLTQGISRTATMQRNLLPVLLKWMSEGTDPDRGLASFRRISESLADSHWYLRLLRDSAGAAQRLSRVLSVSSFCSQLFEIVPDAVAWLDDDELLTPKTLSELNKEFAAVNDRHTDVEEAAKAIRHARRRELLRLSLGGVLGVTEFGALARGLSDLTTATLEASLSLARRDVNGIEFCVVAMGRYGGGELGISSDTDILWVFRDIGAGESAHKLAELTVKAVTRLTEDVRFPLELDAGLRPEGKNGPIVRSLDAYRAYYEAWSDVWETQALLRAVPVAGDTELARDFVEMANSVRYSRDVTPDEVREIRRIKARVENERLPFGAEPSRHLKLGPGSLSDVEWLVQLLQLQQGSSHPAVRTTSTLHALTELTAIGELTGDERTALHDAWMLASRLRNAVALAGGKNADVLATDRRELESVSRLMGYRSGDSGLLENDYLRVTRRARSVFEKIFFPA
jgi:glutamate-ammonia-ligase adenylyltransferase